MHFIFVLVLMFFFILHRLILKFKEKTAEAEKVRRSSKHQKNLKFLLKRVIFPRFKANSMICWKMIVLAVKDECNFCNSNNIIYFFMLSDLSSIGEMANTKEITENSNSSKGVASEDIAKIITIKESGIVRSTRQRVEN